MKLVKSKGPKNAKIVLVGEAPGREEERVGRPFVGRAGKLLDEALKIAGIYREKVYITNVVKFRPKTERGKNRKPSPAEIKKSLPELSCELAQLKPKIIVLLGDVVLRALLGGGYRVSRDHGQIIPRTVLDVRGRSSNTTPPLPPAFPAYRNLFSAI